MEAARRLPFTTATAHHRAAQLSRYLLVQFVCLCFSYLESSPIIFSFGCSCLRPGLGIEVCVGAQRETHQEELGTEGVERDRLLW